MSDLLPSLRALQAFEAIGRLGSVKGAAQELGVTPGAITQQIGSLEDHLGLSLVVKDGRRVALTPLARAYHDLLSQGFEKLRLAQDYVAKCKAGAEITISGLPTLMLKWLGPRLHRFQAAATEVPVRLEATHREPDPHLLEQMFRLTYGHAAQHFPHSRVLFTDICFPVCSPAFLAQNPAARTPALLASLPLIEVDWGPAYPTLPRWKDWFAAHPAGPGPVSRPVSVHSLSSLALEAAANGQGIALAQESFADTDLKLGRLVRLSPDSLPMPEPYFVCWGTQTLEQPVARGFLNWLLQEARAGRIDKS